MICKISQKNRVPCMSMKKLYTEMKIFKNSKMSLSILNNKNNLKKSKKKISTLKEYLCQNKK